MEKLCVWYNPKHNSWIIKNCKCYLYPEVGTYNSYGHLLVEVYEEVNNSLKPKLSEMEKCKLYMSRYKIANKPKIGLLNRFLKNKKGV